MTKEQALLIIVSLLNKLALTPAETYAANEAVKVLKGEEVKPEVP